MKSISQYITESVTSLKPHEKGIIVFDIDDTLVTSSPKDIGVWKNVGGDRKNRVRLSTDEFAKDPDASEHPNWFSFAEFRNPVKVMNSIINGTPILRNLHIMDDYIDAGYEMMFLTARGCEDVIKYAIAKFLRYRNASGELVPIGKKFNSRLSAAVGDDQKNYPGVTHSEKKSNVLKDLCAKYDKVVFVDDDKKNTAAARGLKLPNLRVIDAV